MEAASRRRAIGRIETAMAGNGCRPRCDRPECGRRHRREKAARRIGGWAPGRVISKGEPAWKDVRRLSDWFGGSVGRWCATAGPRRDWIEDAARPQELPHWVVQRAHREKNPVEHLVSMGS